MGRAKEISLKVIPGKVANPFVRRHHYSGTVVNNSCLHFGVFLDGRLHGVMSYGPSLNKSKILPLVAGTGWNEYLELNRMAFDSVLPRNSESRAISLSIRLLKKYAPHVKWIVSFADACSCGDGAIYRASNFVLTGIKENEAMPFTGREQNPQADIGIPAQGSPPGAGWAFLLRCDGRRLCVEEIHGGGGRCPAAGLPAPVYLLYRQIHAPPFDGAGNPLLPDRRTGGRNV